MQDIKKATILCMTFTILIVTYLGLDHASAQAEVETTIIETEPKQVVKEDMSELIALEEAFNMAETDEERAAIKARAQKYLKNPSVAGASGDEFRCFGKNADLFDAIASKRDQNTNYDIPFTGTWCNAGVLQIEIHQNFSTVESMTQYAKTIRSVVGDEIDLQLSNGGVYITLARCQNGPLNDCDPLESGIEMQVTNHGVCTIGMRATLNGTDGFVTAGHCADGETGSDVGQDSISSVIGTVSVETYDAGSNETCDCAFIETDSGSRTMNAAVHWDRYYPTAAADADVMDYVKIYGTWSSVSSFRV